MGAVILIESGAGQVKEFPIEDDLVRVGSGPDCKLRFADLTVPAHAATVEFRNGRYLIHNRTTRLLLVDGKPVSPRANVPWEAGASVQLTVTVTLVLQVSGDPRPAKREGPIDLVKIGIATPDATTFISPKLTSKRRTAQLAVAIACFVIVAALLLKIAADRDEPEGAGLPSASQEFDRLITQLIVIEKEDPDMRMYREQLQTARAAELRGHPRTADRLYSGLVIRLRSRLEVLHQEGKTTGEPTKSYESILRIARVRLRPIGTE